MIRKFFKYKKNERGQGMVEFSLVFPMFIFICLFIIEVGWIAYNYISFDYNYRVASWEIRVPYNNDGTHNFPLYNDEVKKHVFYELKKNNVATDDLDIEDASIVFTRKDKIVKRPEKNDRESRYYMKIQGKMIKNVTMITPVGKLFVGDSFKMSKKLDKLRLMESKISQEGN